MFVTSSKAKAPAAGGSRDVAFKTVATPDMGGTALQFWSGLTDLVVT